MRVFIAVSLSAEFRREISQLSEAMRLLGSGRFVRPDMYHITLAFPGERDAGDMPAIKDAMTESAKSFSTFPIYPGKVGYFGKPDNAIAICGVTGEAKLSIIADAVRANLAKRGIPFDPKPFRAHITLSRHVKITPEMLALKVNPVETVVSGLTLYHSSRIDGVLTYTPIFTTPLTKGE